jgi:hypothetical protein
VRSLLISVIKSSIKILKLLFNELLDFAYREGTSSQIAETIQELFVYSFNEEDTLPRVFICQVLVFDLDFRLERLRD